MQSSDSPSAAVPGPSVTRGSPNERARAFQLAGFTTIPGLFSSDEVAEIRRELKRYVAGRLRAVPAEDVIREREGPARRIVILGKLDRYDSFFRRLKKDQRLSRWAAALLGVESTPLHVDFINKRRGATATAPHQDAFIFTRLPSESLTIWVALDHVDQENGCLCYVPGSHWQLHRPHDLRPGPNRLLRYTSEDRAAEMAVPLRPGDATVHHSFTVHRTRPNRTDRPRWALAVPFVRSDSREVDRREWLEAVGSRREA